MTQDAIVTKCLPNGMAEVVVTRQTACGGSCGSCESCIVASELKTVCRNLIKAVPGQKVVIESKSSRIFKAAMLVYILPIVLFVLGYAVASSLGAGEGTSIIASFIGLFVGAGIIVASQRRKDRQPIMFDIIQ